MPTYVANLDLAKNELRNARVQNLATPPSSPVAGQLYFDSDDATLYFYDGTVWVAARTGAPSGAAGGSLTGTYPNPTLANGVVANAQVAAGAAIAYSKLNLTSSIVDADLAGGITNAKLATNPLARANHTGTQLAATVSDFDSQVRTSRLDQMAAPTGPVSLNNQKITNLLDPSGAQDAASKGYVDATAAGVRDAKDSVRAATTANITLSGTQTIDGVSIGAGDRVLAKDQSTATDNGIYVAAAGAWARSTDADSAAEVTGGLYVWVNEGSTQADTGWLLTTNDAIVLGSTNLTFTQVSGLGQVVAGAGIVKTGNTLDAVGTSNRISVAADSIDISTSYVGQASITTLGTVTTGTWNGTDVAVADGGTGASTAAGAKTNLGFMTRFAANVGDGSATSYNIDHNLGTLDVIVQTFENSSGAQVEVDVTHSTTNRVVLGFATAPASAAYRVVVVG